MNTFDRNAEYGNKILKQIARKKNYEVIFPQNKYSTADCIYKKGSKTALVEHKFRQITENQMDYKYGNKVLMEVDKLKRLIKDATTLELGAVWYITTLVGGMTYIFNLTSDDILKIPIEKRSCPHYTSVGNKTYIDKEVIMLDINSKYCKKIKVEI